MKPEIVVNELSFAQQASSVAKARDQMQLFLRVIAKATSHGFSRALRTHEDLSSTLLAQDYPIAKWRNDNDVDRDLRQSFKSLITKIPLLSDAEDDSLEVKTKLFEFYYQSTLAHGLGAAYLLNTLAISLDGELWRKHEIDIEGHYLDHDGNLTEESFTVAHACEPQHVECNLSILTQLDQSDLSGECLWRQRVSLFPNLSFCDQAGANLISLDSSNPLMKHIIKKLSDLNSYCDNWHSGAFDASALRNVSLESESTMNNPILRKKREAMCPDGITRVFEWHQKISLQAWRIHFLPVRHDAPIVIGYIGPHLATTKNPT